MSSMFRLHIAGAWLGSEDDNGIRDNKPSCWIDGAEAHLAMKEGFIGKFH
jgi:hypothetical protein